MLGGTAAAKTGKNVRDGRSSDDRGAVSIGAIIPGQRWRVGEKVGSSSQRFKRWARAGVFDASIFSSWATARITEQTE